jgi:protein-tyrosine phosphatase
MLIAMPSSMRALDLDWITDELAVGARFDDEHAPELALVHRVRAVIDLRAEAQDDADLLERHGIAFLSLPTLDMAGVTLPMLRDGVAFARDHLTARRRVLVHCEHGVGRSALLALCIIVASGHSPLDALELAKKRRARVSPSPPQYDAWVAWLDEWRQGQSVAWEPPTFDQFAAIAYRHLPKAG